MARHTDLLGSRQIDHYEIDQRLTTREEKDGLLQLAPTIPNFENGIRVPMSTANVSLPPTDAELDSAFGTPATVGTGFIALLDDNGSGNHTYLVVAIGGDWYYESLQKAL